MVNSTIIINENQKTFEEKQKDLEQNKLAIYSNEALKKAKMAKWNEGVLMSYAYIAIIQNI